MALFPAEEARGRELLEQGIGESAERTPDLSTFWVIWNCASEDEVQETLKTLPMYRFFNVDIAPLAPAREL